MIFGERYPVRGRDFRMIGFAIRGKILRPRERRLEQTAITNAGSSTMFRNLLVMDRQNHRLLDPRPVLHLASSRKTARRRFMILRAAFICASNSGLCGVKR